MLQARTLLNYDLSSRSAPDSPSRKRVLWPVQKLDLLSFNLSVLATTQDP